MRAVLTHKPSSIYDDLPWERYHFPRSYLRQVEQAIGDLVVYYEPRREGVGDGSYRGRQSYVATARVIGLRPDPRRPDHFYAAIADYLEFDQPVPFRSGSRYFESGLEKRDGTTNRGAFGRAVRGISDDEFDLIVRAGFTQNFGALPEFPVGLREASASPFWPSDDGSVFTSRSDAARVVTSRAFRDRAFADAVQRAYDRTCALTGLRLINGGGRPEAQAAHIQPVADQGPDTVRNGLALSGTVHWMFDRGLISVAPDGTILTSSKGLTAQAHRLFHKDMKARLPAQPWLRPAPVFLEYHRRNVFKG